MKPYSGFALALLVFLLSQFSPAFTQDVRTVVADNEPFWGSEIELVEEVRIGVLDGDPEYTFGWIADMAMGPDGSIFVVEGQGPVVRKYAPDGKYLHDIGREGEGPGEYKGYPEIAITPDDYLALVDGGNRRVTFYDLDGNHVSDWPLPADLLRASKLTVDTAGNLWVETMTMDRERPEWDWPRSMVKFSPTGDRLASIPIPSEGRGPGAWVLASPAGYMWPFIEIVSSAFSPHGYLVSGSNRDYSFDLLKDEGPVLRVERDREPVKLNNEERSQWEQWGQFFVKQRPSSETLTDIPKEKPAFRELVVDEDGRIWVDRYVKAEHRDRAPREAGDERPLLTWFEPRTFDVFEAAGNFLGTVVLPRDTYIHCRRGMFLLGERTGDLDVVTVVRYRIEQARNSGADR
jgi:sugar lactone lactonase YvrE